LSEEQLVGLLKAKVDDVRVQAIVSQCKVSFALTPEVERKLRAAGASDAVIAAARTPQALPPAPPLPGMTWVDPNTKLMWTVKDNGSDVNWEEAMIYCQQLRLAGFSDWRLPEIGELEGIYDASVNRAYKVKGGIQLSSFWIRSATRQESDEAWVFGFDYGERSPGGLEFRNPLRALCVRRSGK
jgi:hypothetical protein